MHVSLAGAVLFFHIAVAIAAFSIAGTLHVALPAMARARTVAELRPWAAIMQRLEPLLPLLALFLLGLGAWLVHLGGDEGFRFSDGWVLTSIVSLVVIEAAAGMFLAPRSRALVEAVKAAPDGDVTPDLRGRTLDPVVWHLAHVATFGFLGVVFLMTAKPAGAWAPVFPGVGAVLGVALSQLQLRAVSAPAAGDAPIPAPRSAAAESRREPTQA